MTLFTDTFFRKQKAKLEAELGIDDAELSKYKEIVQKRIDYVNNFKTGEGGEEKDWPGFEKHVFRDLLGYSIKDDSPSEFNVDRQKKIKKSGRGGGTGRADGTLGFYSAKKGKAENDQVIVEFKAPDTTDLNSAKDQLWEYLERHESSKWGIVTNFNEFTLYHIASKRLKKQTFYFVVPEDLKEKRQPLSDNEELFKFLAIFRKDRLIAREGQSITEKMLELQGLEENKIEKEFYKEYYNLRIDLFHEIEKHNPKYNKSREELVAITQKILDRLIFIWFCEDSREELLPQNILQRLIGDLMKKSADLRTNSDVWDTIKNLFKVIDSGNGFNITQGYNGELFKPDARIDELMIPNRIFEERVKAIGEKYDFGHEKELSVNILGHIFEQSITDLEELKQGELADKKKGKRKREGVYYTPEYITRYIVEQALGGWLEERRKELGEDDLPELTDEVKKKAPKKGKRKRQSIKKPKLTKNILKELGEATKDEALITRLGFLKPTFQDETELRQALATIPEAVEYIDTIVEMAMPRDKAQEDWYSIEKFWRNYRDVLSGVKVLDPACGSGAFLIQAFDYLYAEGQKVNRKMEELGLGDENLFDLYKEILEKNLYGVDINHESVEITKLSLWLKTASKNKKLNSLFNNIKCGNSLIDDPKVAGEKAFKWEDEFSEIMKDGGFDVVVGNPPYGINFSTKEINWLKENYSSFEYQVNSYVLFYEKGIEIIRKYGYLGYITPATFTYQHYFANIRNIINSYKIINIVKFTYKIFEDAEIGDTVTWIMRKNIVGSYDYEVELEICQNSREIPSSNHKKEWKEILTPDGSYDLSFQNFNLKKIYEKSTFLGEISQIIVGIKPYQKGKGCPKQTKDDVKTKKYNSNKALDATYKPCVIGKNFHRYRYITQPGLYIQYGEWLAEPRFTAPFFEDKIIIRQTSDTIIAHFDDTKSVNLNNVYNVGQFSNKYHLKYILSILNSKLMVYIYQKIAHEKGRLFAEVKKIYLTRLPVIQIDKKQQQPFIEKADTMLDLNKKLTGQKQSLSTYLTTALEIPKLTKKLQTPETLVFDEFIKELKKKKVKTDDSNIFESVKKYHDDIKALKSEIDDTDKEIDQMVYELYGLTEDEIKIVEETC